VRGGEDQSHSAFRFSRGGETDRREPCGRPSPHAKQRPLSSSPPTRISVRGERTRASAFPLSGEKRKGGIPLSSGTLTSPPTTVSYTHQTHAHPTGNPRQTDLETYDVTSPIHHNFCRDTACAMIDALGREGAGGEPQGPRGCGPRVGGGRRQADRGSDTARGGDWERWFKGEPSP